MLLIYEFLLLLILKLILLSILQLLNSIFFLFEFLTVLDFLIISAFFIFSLTLFLLSLNEIFSGFVLLKERLLGLVILYNLLYFKFVIPPS